MKEGKKMDCFSITDTGDNYIIILLFYPTALWQAYFPKSTQYQTEKLKQTP